MTCRLSPEGNYYQAHDKTGETDGNCMGSCRLLVSIEISALAMIPQQGNGPDGLPKGFRAVGILCQEVGALLKAKQLQGLSLN